MSRITCANGLVGWSVDDQDRAVDGESCAVGLRQATRAADDHGIDCSIGGLNVGDVQAAGSSARQQRTSSEPLIGQRRPGRIDGEMSRVTWTNALVGWRMDDQDRAVNRQSGAIGLGRAAMAGNDYRVE